MTANGRSESIDALIQRVSQWAAKRSGIRAVALVGSYARGTHSHKSDVDFVVLSTKPEEYIEGDDWVGQLATGDLIDTRFWGAITERRLRRRDGLEIEVGVGTPSWATVEPVDPGTRRVVTEGIRIVYDPDGLLKVLIAACS